MKVKFSSYGHVYSCKDIVVVMKVFNVHRKGKRGIYKGTIMAFSCILVLLIELWILFLNILLLYPCYNSRPLFLPPLGSTALDPMPCERGKHKRGSSYTRRASSR